MGALPAKLQERSNNKSLVLRLFHDYMQMLGFWLLKTMQMPGSCLTDSVLCFGIGFTFS